MALSQEAQQNILFSNLMGLDKANRVPVAETRERINQIPPVPNPTPVAEVINTTIAEANIPVRIYIPQGGGPFPVVSYYHGGGFVLMSIDGVDEICRCICSKSGSVVMSVGYRLAPEYPYPVGPQDCITATRWMINQAADYKGIGERMAGLPPAMIITCQYDPLRDEGKAYADKLQAAGVNTVYANYENVHGFLGIGKMGQQALQTACDFLKDKLKN